MSIEPNSENQAESLLATIKKYLIGLFSEKKQEKETKESYMKIYEKQSTEKAVRGTQLILQYLATKGVKINPETINVLTRSKEKVESGKKLNGKEEANFWIAYTEVSDIIKPVNAKSLKCIREEFGVKSGFFKKKKISYAERIQGFYRRTSTAVLVLVLFMQVIWLWQNFILKETNEINTKLKEAYVKLHSIKPESSDDNQKKYDLELRVMELNQKLKIQKRNLFQYTSPIQLLCYPLRQFNIPCGKRDELRPTIANDKYKVPENLKQYEDLFEEAYLNDIQELSFSLEILTLYLLPLAYGLLGSCTYILRVIAMEIERQIYIREHDIQYALRILLGTFAGFVIGWFISSDADIQMGFSPTKLSSFAISFLAGYSVELLFTVLDKVVAVYSGAERKTEASESKE